MRKWEILAWIIVGLLAVVALWGWLRPAEATEGSTKTVVVYDTIPYYKPVPKDSVIKKYITVKLPVAEPQDSVIERQDSIVTQDSVKVQIPISQKVYQDSLYKAYISGYRAELDSIFIYNKETTITVRPKPKRWHIGVGAGYGMTLKGFQPYVGVTFSYSIFSF